MTDKEKIRAEVERLKEKGYPINTFEGSAGYYDALDEVLSFINSLSEEPVSEDLEEAANNFLTEFYGIGEPHNPTDIGFFKAGAQWQKQREFVSNGLSKY